MHEYPGTEQEGEEKFVFLKQAAAHVTVQAEREVLIDVHYSLLNIV